MEIRRLGWAGVELMAQGSSLVVDYVQDFRVLSAALPNDSFVEPTAPGRAVAALVTHLHGDHTDVPAIETAVGRRGVVLRPPPFVGTRDEGVGTVRQEDDLAASELDVRVVSDWERVELAPFTITAVPAVDGLGDPQVGWVIEADGQRVFHGGDTLFHGYWWLIARRAGPIDVAVLPINGAKVNFPVPQLQPASELPADLTPEQAAQAAILLEAKALLPMHFGVHRPPYYVEEHDPLTKLALAAAGKAVRVTALDVGDAMDVAAVA